MSEASAQEPQEQADVPAISEIAVSGFKSIRDECRIAIRPLTILAGANSSGKSSIMQPLLMMKQTLESFEDSGALALRGANVVLRNGDSALWRGSRAQADSFAIRLGVGGDEWLKVQYRPSYDNGVAISEQTQESQGRYSFSLRPGMPPEDLFRQLPDWMLRSLKALTSHGSTQVAPEVRRNRCFLEVWARAGSEVYALFPPSMGLGRMLLDVVHVSGVRERPRLDYEPLAVERRFPGTFERYVPSVILAWAERSSAATATLHRWTSGLGLTPHVVARRTPTATIEIDVARTMRSGPGDTVGLNDVGFGVSQVLPVLVSLLAAEPGQLVYIEQPELHLHPRAQLALAGILAEAAQRGIRAVIETHSDLLLLGVQTAVAQGALAPSKVALHWFWRDRSGVTRCRRGSLDRAGRFGKWPEDFGSVTMHAESAYLDAAEAIVFGGDDA